MKVKGKDTGTSEASGELELRKISQLADCFFFGFSAHGHTVFFFFFGF